MLIEDKKTFYGGLIFIGLFLLGYLFYYDGDVLGIKEKVEKVKIQRASDRFEKRILDKLDADYQEFYIGGSYALIMSEFEIDFNESFDNSLNTKEQVKLFREIENYIEAAKGIEFMDLDNHNHIYPYDVSVVINSNEKTFNLGYDYESIKVTHWGKKTMYNAEGEMIKSPREYEIEEAERRCLEGTRPNSGARVTCSQAIEEKYYSNPEDTYTGLQ